MSIEFDMPDVAEAPAREPEIVSAAPKEEALARQSTDLVSRAQALTITDPESFALAGDFLSTLKDQKRRIEEFFADDIARAHAAWKGLTTKRARFVDPIDESITIISARYATFAREERAKAERERREREEQARKAEQERLQREAEARAAEAKRLEEEALAATSLEAARSLEAQAEEAVQASQQLALDAATVQAPVLPLQPTVTPPKGTSVKARWVFEVTDKAALVRAVAAGTVSLEAVQPNETYLGARARADKETCAIPGVRVYDAGSVAVRRAR